MVENYTQKERLEKRPLIIGMVGCLAGGKTTIATELCKRWGITSVEENYPANPFLANFYQNPAEFSFRSQTFFLTSKIEQLKTIDATKVSLIDPSLTMDFLYAQTHHKMGWMNDKEWNLYQNLYFSLLNKGNLVYPDMHIVVNADQTDLQKRIIERGRPYEKWILEKYPEYLVHLTDSVKIWAGKKEKNTYKLPISTSDSIPFNSPEEIADRIESYICVEFGLKSEFELPKIPVKKTYGVCDIFPGSGSESVRLSR